MAKKSGEADLRVVDRIWRRWWGGLDSRARAAKGTVAGALQVLENLKSDYAPIPEKQRTANGEQLKNAGAANLDKILRRRGENRSFLKEGGRTNRGLLPTVDKLLESLRVEKLESIAAAERIEILDELQSRAAQKASDFMNAKKLAIRFMGLSTARVVDLLLGEAEKRKKRGQVAQYLVGAKLSLRFPALAIANRSASSADLAAKEAGDFQIHDSVFHVTVSPNSGHIDKCFANLESGLRVYLLVADGMLQAARQMIKARQSEGEGGKIAVYSIESFVSQNIDEMAEFSSDKSASTLRGLLNAYNRRTAEIESDLSLLIEIPDDLK